MQTRLTIMNLFKSDYNIAYNICWLLRFQLIWSKYCHFEQLMKCDLPVTDLINT